MGADYLAYVLIDSIVDNYFSILEKYGEKIELLEEELTTNPSIETLNTIHPSFEERYRAPAPLCVASEGSNRRPSKGGIVTHQ